MGDKTSLIIAPVVAACGVAVPMISGRGLGHTGGTLDKLESIPGYNVKLSTDEFHRIIDKCGFAMAGQTADIAPADKKLYALRDATATVSCVPLIVASIMSKKLAEGLDALVLDVKTGSGAFVPEFDDSLALARALVRTGQNFGVRTDAVISDMSQPLGMWVGNAHEVVECLEILSGDVSTETESTWLLSVDLSARLLVLAGVADNIEQGRAAATEKISSGEALEKLRQNIEMQGGDPRVCDDPAILLADDLFEAAIEARRPGFISAIDTYAVGNAVAAIGGGRTKMDDKIDHRAGYASLVKIGDAVSTGDQLGVVYCRTSAQADLVREKLYAAYEFSDSLAARPELICSVPLAAVDR